MITGIKYMSFYNWNLLLIQRLVLQIKREEGDMRVYGITVLGFFSCGNSVILIFTYGIVVGSSSAVGGF